MQAEQRVAAGEQSMTPEGEVGGAEGGARVRPKDQLLYLASVLGFNVQFTDFPKVCMLELLDLCINKV